MRHEAWISKVDALKNNSWKKLSKDDFDEFVLEAHIHENREILEEVLTSKKKKNRYFEILDECYNKAKCDESNLSNVQREFVEKVTVEALPYLMEKEAKRFGVNINNPSFPGFNFRVMEKLKNLYKHSNREIFEQSAKEIIRYRTASFCFKSDFLNLLSDDPKYAYCWSQYLNSKNAVAKNDPVHESYEDDAKRFIKLMNESVMVFEKVHRIIYVDKIEELNDFIQTYFVQSKPKTLAIHVKTMPFEENKVIFFLLATTHWIGIIDIHRLRLTQQSFLHLFEYIYDPSIDRIGFNFVEIYELLERNHLTKDAAAGLRMQQKQSGLCIKKLVEGILQNPETRILFGNKVSGNFNLHDVAEAVLGIKWEKERIFDDWNRRPLLQRQMNAIAKNTVILLLLKEKIQDRLKWLFDNKVISKIIQQGYISTGNNNFSTATQCKLCRLNKCVLFPSSMYILLYKIDKIWQLQSHLGKVGIDWNEFRNDALKAKKDYLSLLSPEYYQINVLSGIISRKCYKELKFHELLARSTKITNGILSGRFDGIIIYFCVKCGEFFFPSIEAAENLNEIVLEPVQVSKAQAKRNRKQVTEIIESIFPKML